MRTHSFGKKAKAHARQRLAAEHKGLQKFRPKEEDDDTKIKRKLSKYVKYQDNPVAFAEEVLGVTLWGKQQELLMGLTKPPYRVFSRASHGVGKSFVSGVALLWMKFCFPDSVVISTAPKLDQIEKIIWKTARSLSPHKEFFVGAYRAEYSITTDWFGFGQAPNDPDSFQGFHSVSGDQLIIIDEAVGIPEEIWEAISGLDNDRVRILAICNPTDVTSQAYLEELSGSYEVIPISGLEHPNIIAWCAGEEEPYPGAIQGNHFFELFKKWSDPIPEESISEQDIEFPPGSGQWWRPGPSAQSRLLGKWPTESANTFFSEIIVGRLLNNLKNKDFHPIMSKLRTSNRSLDFQLEGPAQIGIDVARYGEDFSCISVRKGDTIIGHYRIGSMGLIEFSEYIEDLVLRYEHELDVDAVDIPLVIDSTGVGGGLYDILIEKGYNAISINFSQQAENPEHYGNARSEMYACLAYLGKYYQVKLSPEISADYGGFFTKQLLASVYTFNKFGKYLLIPKDKIREKINMSTDDADALCLACYPAIFTVSGAALP